MSFLDRKAIAVLILVALPLIISRQCADQAVCLLCSQLQSHVKYKGGSIVMQNAFDLVVSCLHVKHLSSLAQEHHM